MIGYELGSSPAGIYITSKVFRWRNSSMDERNDMVVNMAKKNLLLGEFIL